MSPRSSSPTHFLRKTFRNWIREGGGDKGYDLYGDIKTLILAEEYEIIQYYILKEHYHVFAHAQDFDFWTVCQEFKDAGMVI